MTNNPKKVVGIKGFGLEIVDRVALEAGRNRFNEEYLRTKAEKMGHLLNEGLTLDKCSNAINSTDEEQTGGSGI